MIGEAGKLNFIVPHEVEAVWHQSGGVVQVFVDGSLHMAMPQAKARELANALLAAARVPDVAAIMADKGPSVIPGSDTDCHVAACRVVYDALDERGFVRWSPETPRDAVLREQYAQ